MCESEWNAKLIKLYIIYTVLYGGSYMGLSSQFALSYKYIADMAWRLQIIMLICGVSRISAYTHTIIIIQVLNIYGGSVASHRWRSIKTKIEEQSVCVHVCNYLQTIWAK